MAGSGPKEGSTEGLDPFAGYVRVSLTLSLLFFSFSRQCNPINGYHSNAISAPTRT
jgi:hypothetical protein